MNSHDVDAAWRIILRGLQNLSEMRSFVDVEIDIEGSQPIRPQSEKRGENPFIQKHGLASGFQRRYELRRRKANVRGVTSGEGEKWQLPCRKDSLLKALRGNARTRIDAIAKHLAGLASGGSCAHPIAIEKMRAGSGEVGMERHSGRIPLRIHDFGDPACDADGYGVRLLKIIAIFGLGEEEVLQGVMAGEIAAQSLKKLSCLEDSAVKETPDGDKGV